MRAFVVLFLFMSTWLAGQHSVHRVEPPNWWIGMKHSQIQLLVFGENLGSTKPAINYPGVNLVSYTAVENPDYLFIDILIAKSAHAGTVPIVFSSFDGKKVGYNWSLEMREEGRSELKGFDASDAIYLVTPDRYANGNAENDSMDEYRERADRKNKGGRHGGDIQGLRNSLDYIKDMGFTALWLNPLLENDMVEYSYHGYSTTDYYKVDGRYGSNEEYKALADDARSRDIGLIMDMIVNHCGSYHWWMENKPMSDWINEWDEMTFTNHRRTVWQDPYASDVDTKEFADGWFVKTMPDLNQRNPYMATYLIQNSIWWIEYLGLAGIRMDTYPYPDQDFMTDWTQAVMTEYPDFNIVGEEWSHSPSIVSYWQKGKQNPNGYTSDLTSVMDFPVQNTFNTAIIDEETWGSGLIKVYEMLAHDYLYPDPFNLVVFPDNHDMTRIYSQLGENYHHFKQTMVFYATIRGIPQFYYGTEILMSSTTDHGDIRSDFPGGWQGDKVNAFTGEGLTDQQLMAQGFTKDLLHWRQSASAIHNGALKHFAPRDGIYVYFRYNDDQKIMIVLSKSEETKILKLDRFKEMLDGEKSALDVISKEKLELLEGLTIPPNSARIFELH